MLLGALIAAEKLIIQPIEMIAAMAKRFGQGDWTVRAAPDAAGRIRSAGARIQCDGGAARRARARTDRHQRPADRDRLDRHAVGLANRRGFQSRLDFEWMKAQQNDSELSLLMIDVDHFKPFNDTHGHPEGEVLTGLGELLCRVRRPTPPAATAARSSAAPAEHRYLASRDVRSARWYAWRSRTSRSPTRPPGYQTVTVSVGVACTKPNDMQPPVDLIESADAALYAANGAAATPWSNMVRTDNRPFPGPMAIAS